MRSEIKKSKTDVAKQRASWDKKYVEYGAKTLEELQEMLPRLGGGYRMVCEYIISLKKLDGNA